MSLSKSTRARTGVGTSSSHQTLAALLLTAALSWASLGPALPVSADDHSGTTSPDAATTTAPTAQPEQLPAATEPAPATSQTLAATPSPTASTLAAAPEGSTVDAETLAKLKAAQGAHGSHMGQGLEQKLGIDANSESDWVTSQATYMPPGIQGLDVSSHQGSVNWQEQRNMGGLFAYVKATEALSYLNPYYASQYTGSRSVGMIRGAYHFAIPNVSSGAAQANYFASNGGGWSGDGWTLPPLLDIEYNPYPELGNTCYNMSPSQMILWIADFSNTMYTRTGRYPAIYTTTDWWSQCTGNSPAFRNQPLHIASYRTVSPGTLPAGWTKYAIWQYSSQGPFAGDSNVFNGSYAELQALATGFDPVLNKYNAMGGASSRLGGQTHSLYCGLTMSGCYRQYAGGQIIWSPNTGAQAVYFSSIGGTWRDWGGVDGRLGYPTTDETCSTTACSQMFVGGAVYWSTSTNAVAVFNGGIGARWLAMGGTSGSLGYPTASETCSASRCSQPFQGGKVLWSSSSGAWAISGDMATAWEKLGGESGRLGYPVGNQSCAGSSCVQPFQGGTLAWTAVTGAVPVWPSAIGAKWQADGGMTAPLGAPRSAESCEGSACRQIFVGGQIFWAPASGPRTIINGEISKKWAELLAEKGRFGSPTSDTNLCGGKECSQSFEGGRVLKDPTAAAPAFGVHRGTGIGALWAGMGSEGARLSYPTSDETCTATTCKQSFRGGTIYWSPSTGQWAVYNGAIGGLWLVLGAEGARLGFPTSNETCLVSSCRQSFSGGEVLWSTTTGTAAVFSGGIGSLWRSLGAESGRLGFPTSTETCAANSCTQKFAGGEILWSSTVGMGAVYNSGIGTVWRSNGAQNGYFGFPTSTETCTANSCVQYFAGGSISWSETGGYVIRRY